ncbi:MAG: hypothetical protein ACP5VS_08555 [Desulfomonilaceae bacterium]
MFHLTVVFQKSDIIDIGSDARNCPKLAVHFYGNTTRVALNPDSLDTDMKVISHFTLAVSVYFTADEVAMLSAFTAWRAA